MKKLDFIFPAEGYCKTTNERVLTYIKCLAKKRLYDGDSFAPIGIAWNSEGWWNIREKSLKTAYSEKYFLDYLDYLDSLCKPCVGTTDICVTTTDTTSICKPCIDTTNIYVTTTDATSISITDKPYYLQLPDYLEMQKLYGVQVVSAQSWGCQETVEYRIKVECKLLNPLPITNYNIDKIKCQNSKKILKFF